MGALSIVPDQTTGVWYRDAGLIAPNFYNLLVRYDPDSTDPYDRPKEFVVKGIDFRLCPTADLALEEASYRLKVKYKPCVLTEEQEQAEREYNEAWKNFNHAKMLVDDGVMTETTDPDSETKLNLKARRAAILGAYQLCVSLGVYYAGNYTGKDGSILR